MPYGVLRWFDPRTGEAEIERRGRVYSARAHDVETAARRPGARVHFDIERSHGVEEAIDVRLRPGTRAARHQHRFGTLVGARRPYAKGPAPYATTHPELRSANAHPLEIARAWAGSVASGDTEGGLSLYAADAVVHFGEADLAGDVALAAWLEATPVFGSDRHARVRGGEDGDESVLISWEEPGLEETGTPEPGMQVRCRMAHARLAEQWVAEPASQTIGLGLGRPTLALSTRGDVGQDAKAAAEEVVRHVVDRLEEPVLFARVKLGHEPDPARLRPAVAEAALDVDGDLVRAHVAARTMPEALDVLARRLADQLEHRAKRRERLNRAAGIAGPGEWRHGDLPTDRPRYFGRPPEERRLVRHKSFAVGELTVDEAVFDMEQLDYDFYLFCERASGSDAIVDRRGDGSYRLTLTDPSGADVGRTVAPVEVDGTEVPVLGLDGAIERLDAGGEPRVFFVNGATCRGNVVYRRYDGHYGLIIPE
jgi:Sigma 54 modulation/S30EA ribosomal protein C terminus